MRSPVDVANEDETMFTDTFVDSAPATVREKMTSERREYKRRDCKRE